MQNNESVNTVRLYSLGYTQSEAWLWAGFLTLCNIAVPQLFHLIPNGGLIFLPIYFFTLIGAYKYGWKVGLLIALVSPLINCLVFDMPPVASLPAILIKGSVLAFAAAFVAQHWQKVNVLLLLAVVLAYQVVGGAIECLIDGNWQAGMQDFIMGWPGMLIQVVLGYIVLRFLLKK